MRETGKGGVQDRCVTYARSRGWYARKFKSPANNAVPDYLFAKRRPGFGSRSFFVEFKATNTGVVTPLQLAEHELMRAAGVDVYVCDDVEYFKTLLSALEP